MLLYILVIPMISVIMDSKRPDDDNFIAFSASSFPKNKRKHALLTIDEKVKHKVA